MSYYILPRIESGVIVKPSLFSSKDKLKPYISQSLITYMNESHLILEQQLGLDINKGISNIIYFKDVFDIIIILLFINSNIFLKPSF